MAHLSATGLATENILTSGAPALCSLLLTPTVGLNGSDWLGLLLLRQPRQTASQSLSNRSSPLRHGRQLQIDKLLYFRFLNSIATVMTGFLTHP
jgi:hypothetical protein